tara:strand:+ start:3824 stop:3970 length:147 start_codon:yes stop_codon:yes gene_type:complete
MKLYLILFILFIVGWIWIIYELITSPIMPDDWGLTEEEKKEWNGDSND